MEGKSKQEVVIKSTINYKLRLVLFILSTVLCSIFYYITNGTSFQFQYPQPKPKFNANGDICYSNKLRIHNTTKECQKCFITYEDANYRGGRRLGNHIYNVASLISIAKWNNMTPILPENARIFLSMNVPVKTVKPSVYDQLVKESSEFKEIGSRQFDPRTRNLTCNVTLVGYYQSWRYLEDVKHIITKSFKFKDKFTSEAKRLFNSYTKNKDPYSVIGIHVRRGFTLASLKKRGYVTPGPSYFKHAMDYYQNEIYPNKTLLYLISSDDINWCKQNIKGKHMVYSTAKTPEVDMVLQSLCNDTVTSLGSFGWWCGYFAQGHVTYFKDFAKPGSAIDKEVNQRDMFNSHWKAIS